MSKMSDLHVAITEELNRGQLSYYEIAYKLDVPYSWVEQVAGLRILAITEAL
jgi:hypothetical protein